MSTAPAMATTNQNSIQGPVTGNSDASGLDSEIKLVSSLAKLQELERKIHELRGFMPQGLLEPLVPISNPDKVTLGNPIAETPRILRASLDEAARARVADVQQFQSLWRDPELTSVWAHVESRIKEANGQLLQPTGKWERDYDVLLEELAQKEKSKVDEHQREDEEAERIKAQSTEGEWKNVLERFIQRDMPGVRVITGQDETSLAIALVRAGVVFQVKGVSLPGCPVSDWEISSKIAGRSPTKLEDAILECVRSRQRKWDLAFLLDMISSYADIKQTPCVKCNRLTDNGAQLPTLRRPQANQQSVNGPARVYIFDALHFGCV
ncbi:Mediator complex, subunit Med27 [Penicillium expansum]|uniref:Mediator complex, subunit Med27 n=1 Tax=Penicillium expansum TaxID=27334 RepID=A0A0A2IPL6_PENEN|nr:Mediator complex, subunit Med27 [Penicillium expansum]KAJ5498259.1 Mediator complex subunit Med27 [Penicillium expansum]KGO44994.1 Mediator complex, subunit Med27 [Penicillium expansum]KGO47109.1 Mediator complex, subunit Med27 [Penicillium expansum]KGO60306.1 Mediator complex, subunit Med27 [Penicillium expansum]